MTNSLAISLSLFLTLIPLVGLMSNVLFNKKSMVGAQLAAAGVGIGLILSFTLLSHFYANNTPIYFLGFKADSLGFLMTTLIFFVSTVVHQFSIRYMAGDQNYKPYFYKLSLLTSSAAIMALADQLLLFFVAWCVSNLLLISLMIHKQKWDAAASSGKLAFTILLSGAVIFLMAIVVMYLETGSFAISIITQQAMHSPAILVALFMCIITAMTQSALWPFHRWLTSSLNSPTPISAIMHAGLVNGGGFLLVRFAPLLVEHTILLNLIFCIGVISAVLGTLWKLVQSDVKRMLACSTMGQMGFMMMQCGLGAGSVVQSQKADSQSRTSSLSTFVLSCTYGLLGAYSFACFSGKTFFSMNTTAFLVGFAFIAATQVTHSILQKNITFSKNLLAITAAIFSGDLYGCSIHLIETVIPSSMMVHHSINALHLIAFMIFLVIWLTLNLNCLIFIQNTNLWKRIYMALLNGSQPHPKTITSIRQSYQY